MTLTAGGLDIQNATLGDDLVYGGGAHHASYHNIILRGNTSTGVSGIGFTSSKGTSTINVPSDCAFIQFHPYNPSLAAIGSNPTLGTSGESNKLVIGVNNDSDDMIYLQTPAANGLKHVVGTTVYDIIDTGNISSHIGSNLTVTWANVTNKPYKWEGGLCLTDGDQLNMKGSSWDGFAFNYESYNISPQGIRFYNGARSRVAYFGGDCNVTFDGKITTTFLGVQSGYQDDPVRYICCYGKTSTSYINFGYTNSVANCGELCYSYVSSGSGSNWVGIGFYGRNHVQFYYNSNTTFHGAVYTDSDRHLKKNIHDIDKRSLIDLFNVSDKLIKKFTWKRTCKDSYGFIAQQVEKYIPEAVTIDEKNIKSVSSDIAFAKIIASLINEIKILKRKIKE